MLMAAVALVAPLARAQQDVSVSVTLEVLPGVQVTAPAGQGAAAGDTVYYLFRVQNTGGLTTGHRLSLTASRGWTADLPLHGNKYVGPLPPGAQEIIPVAVTAPADASLGSTGSTSLAATAIEKPRPSDEDTVITTVVLDPGLPETVTAPPGQSGPPGTAITYAFELRNVGVTDATFRLRASSSPRWNTYLPGHPSGKAGPLAPNQVEAVTVVVEIPAGAGIGETCDMTLRAIRQGRPQVEGEDLVTTTVTAPAPLRVALLQPAEGGVYTVRITNITGSPQRVRLSGRTVGGAGASFGGIPQAEADVAPGATSELALSVSRGAQGQVRGYVIVEAEILGGGPLRLFAAARIK
jgi:hypothetical protein